VGPATDITKQNPFITSKVYPNLSSLPVNSLESFFGILSMCSFQFLLYYYKLLIHTNKRINLRLQEIYTSGKIRKSEQGRILEEATVAYFEVLF
jgi:hypothetical protein